MFRTASLSLFFNELAQSKVVLKPSFLYGKIKFWRSLLTYTFYLLKDWKKITKLFVVNRILNSISLYSIPVFCMVLACEKGTFGYDCLNNCSGNCLNDSLCNKQNGHCDRGCNPGYTNTDCSKGMFYVSQRFLSFGPFMFCMYFLKS